MDNVILVSPDGKTEISVFLESVKHLKEAGWSEKNQTVIKKTKNKEEE
jgi:hypothetical protein|tara:strand:- start:696 stop:839 length:144 start_codon:yes stop_codon:yes gene_type:complete